MPKKTNNNEWYPVLNLNNHPTIQDFMNDDSDVRIVKGPVGSGKSTCVGCGEIMRRTLKQEPSPVDNIIYVKATIIRNTMPDLRATTVPTWQSLFPSFIPKFREVTLTHHIKQKPTKNEPGLDFLAEFVGLDKVKDVSKLLSREMTILWFNEVKEIPKEIIDMATTRMGRYPSIMQGGVMPTWSGIIMDTNPWPSGHWLDDIEKNPPQDWKIFKQPPAVLEMEKRSDGWHCIEPNIKYVVTDEELIHKSAGKYWAINPNAENLKNLPINRKVNPEGNPLKRGAYYARALAGKDESYIKIYLQGYNGTLTADRAVIKEFSPSTMISHLATYNQYLPLVIGIDFGAGTLNPAAVFGQLDMVNNRWLIIRELVCQGMGLMQFADQMLITIQKDFGMTNNLQIWGDPAGLQRDGVEMKTYFDHLASKGLYAEPAPTNKIGTRIECIKAPMLRFANNQPCFLVNPKCTTLIEGLSEKWYYKRLNVAGEVRYDEMPCKDHPHSDVCEALGYLLSGGGEHMKITLPEHAYELNEQSFNFNDEWDIL